MNFKERKRNRNIKELKERIETYSNKEVTTELQRKTCNEIVRKASEKLIEITK